MTTEWMYIHNPKSKQDQVGQGLPSSPFLRALSAVVIMMQLNAVPASHSLSKCGPIVLYTPAHPLRAVLVWQHYHEL